MDGGKLVYCGEGNDLLQAALREVGGQEEGKLLLVPRCETMFFCKVFMILPSSLQPDGSLAYTLQPKVESPASRPKVSILRQPHKPKV